MHEADPGESGEQLDGSVAAPPDGIQAIDRASVHRICSGQVVLTLATAVKELVENSVDAGATAIEVRLKEHGTELIEVSDNGCGVEAHNFRGLTLKHHTSKLRDFSDLTYVETFGFRGEALSSLCALSKMTVTTCHESINVGTRLEFDHNGHITNQTACARLKGTTVMLENLFSTLPVRHKEFQRNIKKEFTKMVQVISAYCLISTGVKIVCTNQVGKGKKNTVVNVHGNDSMKENITNIFGAKQVQNLIQFKQCIPSEEICNELNIKRPEQDNQIFKITGYVSSSEHGKGRGSSDRQFYFINKRPCDFQKISRTVNEVYHQYNKHQNPFVAIDITLDKESVDVNVTPDKRQIFVAEEKLLVAIIKSSLIQMFEPLSSTYQMNLVTSTPGSLSTLFGRPNTKNFSDKPESAEKSFKKVQDIGSLKRGLSCPPSQPTSRITTGALANLKRSFSSAFAKECDIDNADSSEVSKQRKLDVFLGKNTKLNEKEVTQTVEKDSSLELLKVEIPESSKAVCTDHIQDNQRSELKTVHSTDSGFGSQEGDLKEKDISTNVISEIQTKDSEFLKCSESSIKFPDTANVRFSEEVQSDGNKDEQQPSTVGPGGDMGDSVDFEPTEVQSSIAKVVTEYDKVQSGFKRKTVQVPFSMSKLKEQLNRIKIRDKQPKERTNTFHAKINPADNTEAENELKKEIKKESFKKMEILGQFNKGFIITRLGQDLFIVDQHATDEKYNFEQLQAHTVIKSQKLIQPQNLELTAVNENVLMENIEIFQKNGFEFEIDEAADPTKRVRLVSMPVSKTWVFGKDDIEELIFMLSDEPGVLCRPSRVRMMFASRACRKSIMVGTALNHRQMTELMSHMSEIEQPWNCPHGRPTMRHLVNLDALPDS